jgi:hypothetical protein
MKAALILAARLLLVACFSILVSLVSGYLAIKMVEYFEKRRLRFEACRHAPQKAA